MAWIMTKITRISLTTDRLASGRYNSGTDPVLYSGVMLSIQDFNNEGYISRGPLNQFGPLSWLDQPRINASRVTSRV